MLHAVVTAGQVVLQEGGVGLVLVKIGDGDPFHVLADTEGVAVAVELLSSTGLHEKIKGDIIFVNSETVHRGTPRDAVYECIVFHSDFLYSEHFDCFSFVKNIIDGECMINEFFPADSGKGYDALCEVFEAIGENRPSCKFLVVSAFYKFFAEVYEEKLYTQSVGERAPTNDKSILMLKTIFAFLRENYDKPLTLESISQTIEKSPKYVGAFFKRMTGKTPIEYLNEYRIEKAARKLRLTDMSVTDVAFSSGFSDLSYFIKTFKRIKGVSPGKYRTKA